MNQAVAPFLTIILFLLVVGLVIWGVARQMKRARENVRQLAATLGLQFEARTMSPSRASGQLRGKRVEVFSFTTGSGKSSCQWCAVSAAVPAAGSLTFHLRRQGFGTKFMELFGAKEIQVGEAEFDRTWFIQTNQPEFLREALLPELREKINVLVRELGTQARGARRRPSRPGRSARRRACRRPVPAG